MPETASELPIGLSAATVTSTESSSTGGSLIVVFPEGVARILPCMRKTLPTALTASRIRTLYHLRL